MAELHDEAVDLLAMAGAPRLGARTEHAQEGDVIGSRHFQHHLSEEGEAGGAAAAAAGATAREAGDHRVPRDDVPRRHFV